MEIPKNEDASPPTSPEALGLETFRSEPEDNGLSLEELSTAYAELLNRGSTPYEEPPATETPSEPAAEETPPLLDEPQPSDLACDLSPKSILEAILFVGNSNNQPLTSRQVASMMRGVRAEEIDDLVAELNAGYAADGSCYEIASVDAGYLLQLRSEFHSLRDTFFGRVKEARLTQPAIDVLAIVAYKQPISREEIDQIRGRPSGGLLSQLLRRGLLRLDRAETPEPNEPRKSKRKSQKDGEKAKAPKSGSSKVMHYRTTDRFLQLFGLENINELPQSTDVLPDG